MPTSSMVLWGERHGIGVNRTTRTAQPGLLYSMECAPDGLRLTAKASGCLAKADSEILKSATKSIVAMGGSSSRGLGRCECQMV